MSIPMPANRTFDLFHQGTWPNPPDIAGAHGYLTPDFRGGQEGGDRGGATWTHIMLVEPDLDVRDGYYGLGTFQPTSADTLYIPDKDGTGLVVVFIERIQVGTANEHKRLYLDRLNPPFWPTNDL